MRFRRAVLSSAVLTFGAAAVWCQPPSAAVMVNWAAAKLVHEPSDAPGAQSFLIREDPATNGLELLVSYPAGHVFALHWHESNERIILLEGRLSLGSEKEEKFLEPGGFAYLPAREIQRLACVSNQRCLFYVLWDGNPASHAAKQ